MTNIDIYILILLLVFLCGVVIKRQHEKQEWNNGVCKKTGKNWKLVDRSSQGCRLYRSEEETCWISYGVDK